MIQNRVMAVGAVLLEDEDAKGYYVVNVWTRLAGTSGAEHEVYSRLTYLEALEVITAHCDTHRPGWALGDGWSQPPLDIA